jgi:hypothetical protein
VEEEAEEGRPHARLALDGARHAAAHDGLHGRARRVVETRRQLLLLLLRPRRAGERRDDGERRQPPHRHRHRHRHRQPTERSRSRPGDDKTESEAFDELNGSARSRRTDTFIWARAVAGRGPAAACKWDASREAAVGIDRGLRHRACVVPAGWLRLARGQTNKRVLSAGGGVQARPEPD